jgi:small multidrug resistance pump
MSIIIYIIAYLLCSTAGLMFLKSSIISLKLVSFLDYLSLFTNIKFIFGFLLYVISFLTWLVLLSRKDLSYIYPIVIGLSYFLIMLTAALFLREGFTVGKIIGASFIGIGIIIIFIQR